MNIFNYYVSKNFKFKEIYKSDYAKKNNIENVPFDELNNLEVYTNAVLLIHNCLQPIREHFNKPIDISSFYRCKGLNNAIKGATTSQHLEGKACDFMVRGVNKSIVIDYIKNNLKFDQLICEPNWIHISFNYGNNRGQILRAARENGKMIYTAY